MVQKHGEQRHVSVAGFECLSVGVSFQRAAVPYPPFRVDHQVDGIRVVMYNDSSRKSCLAR